MNILKKFIEKLLTPEKSRLEEAVDKAREEVEPIKIDPIRCIAQRILKDLEEKEKWKIERCNPFIRGVIQDVDEGDYFYRTDLNKKYCLYFRDCSFYDSLILVGIDYRFNKKEKNLIKAELDKIIVLNYERQQKQKQLIVAEKLKELFPECGMTLEQ